MLLQPEISSSSDHLLTETNISTNPIQIHQGHDMSSKRQTENAKTNSLTSSYLTCLNSKPMQQINEELQAWLKDILISAGRERFPIIFRTNPNPITSPELETSKRECKHMKESADRNTWNHILMTRFIAISEDVKDINNTLSNGK